MQTFFNDYVKLLEERYNEILLALEGLPTAALDWDPANETNSISALIFHLTGAARFWIGDVAAQDSSNRDRESEFKVHDLSVDMLKQRLADNLTYTCQTLDKFTVQYLEKLVKTKDGREVTIGWALLHALEHATLHLGQIQLTRQLWEQKK